jgi:hypothetical protein
MSSANISFHLKNLFRMKEAEEKNYDNLCQNLERYQKELITKNALGERIDLEGKIEEIKESVARSAEEISRLEKLITEAESGSEDAVKEVFSTFKTEKLDDERSDDKDSQIVQLIGRPGEQRRTATETDDDNVSGSKIDARSLFKPEEPIENILVYVATFFPNLTPYDFNQVVSVLLEGRTMKITTTSKILTKDGEIREIEKEEDQSLQLIWEESLGQPDKYLKKCHLKSLLNEAFSRVIDFDPPQIRDDLKTFFNEEQSLYIDGFLKRTQFFIFHPSVDVAKGAIDLLIDAMMTHPNVYDEDWLTEIIQVIKDLAITEDWGISLNLDPEQQLYKLLKEIKEVESRRETMLLRLSALIFYMLQGDLRPVAKRFFEKLLLQQKYDAVLIIVDNLSNNLQDFDEMHWLKQLLDRGDDNTRTKSYRLLYRKLKQSGYRIYEFLESLKAWLPKKGSDPISHSSKSALNLLIDYCSDTVSKLPEESYGLYPPKYQLFRPFQRGDIDQKLELIISWLLLPGANDRLAIESVLNKDVNVIEFLGSLFSEWFLILHGLGVEGELATELNEASNCLIQQILNHSTRSKQKDLMQFWTEYSDYLLFLINRQAEVNTSESLKNRKRLIRRRNSIRQLNRQFKSLQKSA